MSDLIDASTPCRPCRGTGTEEVENGHGGFVWEPCLYCGGTGRKTLRTYPGAEQAGHHATHVLNTISALADRNAGPSLPVSNPG